MVQRRACPFCRSYLEGIVEWCYFCGKRLPQEAPAPPAQAAPTVPEPVATKPPSAAPSPLTNVESTAGDPLDGAQLGSFRIIGRLGTGGMGAVYLGEHPQVGKRVAIKILRPELAANRESIARFVAEARMVTRLRHPSIVDVYDFGNLPEIGSYLIMEYLEGDHLLAYLQKRGALSPYEAAFLAWQILDALEVAHNAGIIHRDLKLENVFLVRWGGRTLVKLLDFGLAKLVEPAPGDNPLQTRAGVVLGTPAYMSPEQASGSRELDGRSDIYSLGVILFELVTGQSPFYAKNANELLLIKQIEPAPPASAFAPGIPKPLEQLILRCMERVPNDRPPNVRTVRMALSSMMSGLPRRPVSSLALPESASLPAAGDSALPLSPEEVQNIQEGNPNVFFPPQKPADPAKVEPKPEAETKPPSSKIPEIKPPSSKIPEIKPAAKIPTPAVLAQAKAPPKPAWHDEMQALRAQATGIPSPLTPPGVPIIPPKPSPLPWIVAGVSSVLSLLLLVYMLVAR